MQGNCYQNRFKDGIAHRIVVIDDMILDQDLEFWDSILMFFSYQEIYLTNVHMNSIFETLFTF